MVRPFPPAAALALAAAFAAPAAAAPAADKVVNVFTARHYSTDMAMYARFTALTGIKVNAVEGKEEELLEKLQAQAAPAGSRAAEQNGDVLITVDAARLGQADALGLFAPIRSKVLERRIPPNLHTRTWVSLSKRARMIAYAKGKLDPAVVQDYEDLAAPGLQGKVCVRSGQHPYNLSLGSSMIVTLGEARTEQWARGLVANLARPPRGGDTDQLRAVAADECQVALVNSYYVARLLRSEKPEDREAAGRLGFVWPNQRNRGTHVNVSGGGVLKAAPHPAAALKLLEYLASDEAQAFFADGDNEWPAVPSVRVRNPALEALGPFRADVLDVASLSRNVQLAAKVFERAGWR